ncbi:MAG: hypothetical protein S4CHLAM20_10990 [Chlamydiia bacterium]|nr:hypothetical protein [Chlamydiia bacterium]
MRYLLVFLTSVSLWAQDNKIIHIVSTVRSLSTAMFRMFENHEDFTGFLEPNVARFFRKHISEDEIDDWIYKDAYHSFDEVKKDLYEGLNNHHVVLKDISCVAKQYIMSDDDYVKNPNVHFVLVLRNPYEILQSIYRKDKTINKMLYDYVGVKQLYEIYEKVKNKNPNRVHLVFVDDLVSDPKETIEPIFNAIGIPFSEKCLSWDSIDEYKTVKEWRQVTKPFLSQIWHGSAFKSTHITKLSNYPKPTSEEEFYLEILNDQCRALHIDVYKYHYPYYKKFLEEKK